MASTLQAIVNAPQSEKLKQALKMTPRILDVYFSRALRDVTACMLYDPILLLNAMWLLYKSNLIFVFGSVLTEKSLSNFAALICALIPLLMLRYATIFPDKNYSYEV